MADARPPTTSLQESLKLYLQVWREPTDAALVERFHALLAAHPDALSRTCLVGHITASAWIVDESQTQALLTHHRKLDKWLQLGGHVDGEDDPAGAALREAREESGLTEFKFVQPSGLDCRNGGPVPLDLDVHEIPARGEEPTHLHYDVRYLLRAAAGELQPDVRETKELRFVPFAELPSLTQEESVLRLQRRAAGWLAGRDDSLA